MTPLMLPVAPKDVGRLSDVFISALASLGDGGENRLRLPKVRHSVVVLVVGLGFENLRETPAYARFLTQNLNGSMRCEFPSTTATSIAGFATSVRSNQHGLIGYSAYDRSKKANVGLLTGWNSVDQALRFKRVPTVSELAKEVKVFSIGPKAYEQTGFTALTMPGASYLTAEGLGERFERVEEVIRSAEKTLSYVYVPELDQIAHKNGVTSDRWLHALEELDLIINRFSSKLGNDVGVLITADHGVIDVLEENHVYLDDFDWYVKAVESTAGDPRCSFVYLADREDLLSLKAKLQSEFGHEAYICEPQELTAAGWLGVLERAHNDYFPDLYVIWESPKVSYDRRFAKPTHMKMIGQHGGISDCETRVPLIRLGSY